MKILVVELSDCILCQVCAAVSPAVFKLNDAGFIEVTELPAYLQDEVNEAIKHCPARCIFWEKS